MLRVAEQYAESDTGRQRSANEDSYFARAPVFVVADGMGGAQAGEVASQVATEAFEPGNERGEGPEAYLRGVAEGANARIHELSQEDSSRSGMGTTLTAVLVEDDEISIAHVGDSRAYLWRDGELKRLTSDHSLVEELRRQGRLTESQAAEHPQRSIITRALGPEPTVKVDTMSYPAQARRRLPALLGRADDDAPGRADRQDPRAEPGPAQGRQDPDPRGERGRRSRQHHRRRLPPRGGRRGDAPPRARRWSAPRPRSRG